MVRRRKLSVLIILFISCLGLCFSSRGFKLEKVRADDDVRYTKKVVSVLFDNSGSMQSYNGVSGMSYALYSLQMLISSLNSQDVLQIVPLNKKSGYSSVDNDSFIYNVNLADSNRERVINEAVNNTVINSPNGSTPDNTPMTCAINSLKAQGMKSVDDKESSPEGIEYWLVVLTDGEFDNYRTAAKTAEFIHNYVKDYQSLKTIYIAFGDSANDLSGYNTDIPFTPYTVSSMDGIISVMQKVTGQMSGRYSLDKKQYTVKGNKVYINLDSIEYSLRGISVIAQNCDAVLNGATYNGSQIDVNIGSVIEPNSDLASKINLKKGYSAVIDGNPYFSGGELILTYSANVDSNALAIYVEPALRIEMYLEYFDGSSWKETDMQYINSHLTSKDKIRVGYRVHEQVKGKLVDASKIFGSSKMEVTYAGKLYETPNSITDGINLVVGKKEISVTVNVSINKDFDDYSYEMRANMMCIIEQNPTYYRVEGLYESRVGGNQLNHKITYTVYSDNSPVSYGNLSKYQYTISMSDDSGKDIPISVEAMSNGKLVTDIKLQSGEYGIYTVTFEIKSEDNITRKHEQTFYYYPESVIINCIGDSDFSLTQHALKNSSKSVKFEVLTDGNSFSLSNNLLNYKVELNGKDITNQCNIEGNTVEFIPNEENVTGVGNKRVTLTVNSTKGVEVKQVSNVNFEILSTVYGLEKVDYPVEPIDIYNLPACESALYFKPTIDGEELSKEETESLLDSGEISIKYRKFGFTFLLPCKVEMAVDESHGEPLIQVRVVGHWNKTLSSLFASFMFDSDKEVTVSFNGAEASGIFTVSRVTFQSRLIRWGVILAILFIIIYILVYIAGFFTKKTLPRGVFVIYYVDDFNEKSYPSTYEINMKFSDRLKWHIKRLLPIYICGFQTPYNKFGLIKLEKNASGIWFKFKDDVISVRMRGRPEYKSEFESYTAELDAYVMGQTRQPISDGIETEHLKSIFSYAGRVESITAGSERGASNDIYAQFDEENNLKTIAYFVFNRY